MDDELGYASLCRLSALLAQGSLGAAELAQDAVERVAALDRRGPALHAVIALDPAAADPAAAAAPAGAPAALPAGPLRGIPVLVKDSFDTAGLATTAGSLALSGVEPPRDDAAVVARLRQAGALILGKTNLSEWSNLRGRGSISGWSGAGGQTRNPHALDRSPGGSSSGSAAAVAAGYAPAALGGETDGSILCPAALCGVVGLKPTVGLVSRAGAIGISSSQDTIGPITRTVADAAVVLRAIAGSDPADPATSRIPAGLPAAIPGPDELARATLSGVRLGVPRRGGFFGYHGPTDRLIEQALEQARAAGAVIVDPADTGAEIGMDEADELTVLVAELAVALGDYLPRRFRSGPGPRSLAEVVAFNTEHAGQELALFGQEWLQAALVAPGPHDPGYREALRRNRQRARAGLDDALRTHRLDALVVPTMGPAWLIDPVNGDAVGGAGYGPSAVAGYPAVTLPAGRVAGLPVGLCLLGTAWSEPALLRIAAGFEQLGLHAPRPTFAPAADRSLS